MDDVDLFFGYVHFLVVVGHGEGDLSDPGVNIELTVGDGLVDARGEEHALLGVEAQAGSLQPGVGVEGEEGERGHAGGILWEGAHHDDGFGGDGSQQEGS